MDMKCEKMKKVCYKKAFVRGINYDEIVNTVSDIMEECDEISYYDRAELDELTDTLGDEELAYEFKTMFGTLSADCNQLWSDLQDTDIPEYFNDFFIAVNGRNFGGCLDFYDEEQGDYFGLDSGEAWDAENKAEKRIERLTKTEIIRTATKCFRIFMAFVGIQCRYQDLKTAFDILKDKHSGFLQTIKRINDLYAKAEEEQFWGEQNKEFDRLLDSLPYDVWVQ